jgi:hypothetical protein
MTTCNVGHGPNLSAEEYNALVRDAMLWRTREVMPSETERSGWVPVTDGLPADQPGGWLVFNTDTGKLWFETNLPSWWNRKDERGREFDGPAVTHWREDFYPLPGPRK